jgi:hypothetical protein
MKYINIYELKIVAAQMRTSIAQEKTDLSCVRRMHRMSDPAGLR